MEPPRPRSKKNGFRKNRCMVATTYEESYGEKTSCTYTREKPVKGWEGCTMGVLGSRGERPSQQERRADPRAEWTNHPTSMALEAASLCTKMGHCFPISNWHLVFIYLSLHIFGHCNESRQRRYITAGLAPAVRDTPGLQAHGSSICLVSCNGGHWCNESLAYLEINVNYKSFVLHRDVEESDNLSNT